MPRLDEHVAMWKQQVMQAEEISPSDLAELEQHLRDSVAELQQRGLSEDEAFWVARSRLGTGAELASEYGKVNGGYIWRRRVFWMVAGYLVLRLAGAWIGTFSTGATAAAAYLGLNGSALGAIGAVIMCLGWVAALAGLYCLAMLLGPGQSRWLTFTSVTVTGVVIVIATLLGVLLTTGGRVVTTRLVSAESYGQTVMWASGANLLLQLMIPIACLLMIWSLRRHRYGMLS